MNANLNVTRFNNEDVIATSFCEQFGVLHFFTTSRGAYSAQNNSTTFEGIQYIYNDVGELQFVGDTLTMTVPGRVTLPVGKYFYFNGQGYVLCEDQAHGR